MGRSRTRLKDIGSFAETLVEIPPDWVIEEQRREEQRRREERPTLRLPLPYETEPPRAAPQDAPKPDTVVTFDISTGL
jgi:hypothetical protein